MAQSCPYVQVQVQPPKGKNGPFPVPCQALYKQPGAQLCPAVSSVSDEESIRTSPVGKRPQERLPIFERNFFSIKQLD